MNIWTPPPRPTVIAAVAAVLVVVGIAGVAVLKPANPPAVSAQGSDERFERQPLKQPLLAGPAPAPRDAMVCSSFATIDHITSAALQDNTMAQSKTRELPDDPIGTPSTRPPADYIGLADALNNTERNGASTALDSALTAYVYALSNLGATINHHESRDSVETMTDFVFATGRTVRALCPTA